MEFSNPKIQQEWNLSTLKVNSRLYICGMKAGVVIFPGSNCDQDLIQALIKHNNAEVVEFENAGHWLHHDQFQRFVKTLKDFL